MKWDGQRLSCLGHQQAWRLWEARADACRSAKGRGYDHGDHQDSNAGLGCHTSQVKWHSGSRNVASSSFISLTVIAKGTISLPTCIYPTQGSSPQIVVKGKANLVAIRFSPFRFAQKLASILKILVFCLLSGSKLGEAGEFPGGSPQKVHFSLLASGHSNFLKLSGDNLLLP